MSAGVTVIRASFPFKGLGTQDSGSKIRRRTLAYAESIFELNAKRVSQSFEDETMESMVQVAARLMDEGITDLKELGERIHRATGKRPSYPTLTHYRSYFNKHGRDWVQVKNRESEECRRRNPAPLRSPRKRRPRSPEEAGRVRETSRRWNQKNPVKALHNTCRHSAAKRGLECTITLEDVEQLAAPMTCSMTGLPLTWERSGTSKARPWAPSIDRIDCSVGYVPGNVRIVCWAFNQARSDYSDEVVLTLARALVMNQGASA